MHNLKFKNGTEPDIFMFPKIELSIKNAFSSFEAFESILMDMAFCN